MVYFNQRAYTPKTREETDQWGQVLDFQRNFPKEGLWWPYRGRAQFERLVRNHLTQFLRQQGPDPAGTQRIPSEPVPPTSVQQHGSGAVAIGPGAVAAGAGGVAVGGSVSGNITVGRSAAPEPLTSASAPAAAQIFLCYARQDEDAVRELYQRLSAAGFKPWMDQEDIYPGEQWQGSIERAIEQADFFLACLSTHAVSRRGFLQREIKTALDRWQEKLHSDIYLIPARLEPCEVPEELRNFQWVDLYHERGWPRLLRALQVGLERRRERPDRVSGNLLSSSLQCNSRKHHRLIPRGRRHRAHLHGPPRLCLRTCDGSLSGCGQAIWMPASVWRLAMPWLNRVTRASAPMPGSYSMSRCWALSRFPRGRFSWGAIRPMIRVRMTMSSRSTRSHCHAISSAAIR